MRDQEAGAGNTLLDGTKAIPNQALWDVFLFIFQNYFLLTVSFSNLLKNLMLFVLYLKLLHRKIIFYILFYSFIFFDGFLKVLNNR